MYNGERIDSLTNGAEKSGYAYTKRMKLKPHLITYTKMNLQKIEDLNVQLNSVKFLDKIFTILVLTVIHRYYIKSPGNKRKKRQIGLNQQ